MKNLVCTFIFSSCEGKTSNSSVMNSPASLKLKCIIFVPMQVLYFNSKGSESQKKNELSQRLRSQTIHFKDLINQDEKITA